MNDKDLARAVAAELGTDIAGETDRMLRGELLATDQSRAFGLSEAMAVGAFLPSCAQLALQIWHEHRDRVLLLRALLEKAPVQPGLDAEKRLALIGKITNKLVPESIDASPSLGTNYATTKQDWINKWLGIGTRALGPTVLMPFGDMDYYIVYRPISWSPPNPSADGLPTITVPKGFVTDLASIPIYFWWFLPPTGRHGHAAILHDWLYWEQGTSREVADRIFDEVMQEMAVSLLLRKAMWSAVRVYAGGYWDEGTKEKARGVSRVLKRFPDTPVVTWNEWRNQPDVFA
jgi:hypothetical protein